MSSPRPSRPGASLAVAFALSFLFGALAAGCRHGVTPLPAPLETALAASGGAYLVGPAVALEEQAVLERRNFVYAVALSPTAARAAFTRLDGTREVRLAFFSLAEAERLLWEVPVNAYAHDVEGIAISPDGAVVATASRSGVGRFFSTQDGTPLGRFVSEEPLTEVAFHPSGRYALFGSARGRLMAVRFPGLTFAGELHAHEGELRGLAIAPDGTVYTGGWDGTLGAFGTEERTMAPEIVHVPVRREGGRAVLQGELNGAPATLAVDGRAAYLFVTQKLARSAGMDPARLTETVTVEGPLGTLGVKRARNARLVLKGIALDDIDVAVCDSCVPAGTEGVLGAPLYEQAEVRWDRDGSLVLAPREARRAATLGFLPRYRVQLGGPINDVTVDHDGERLGVALSPERAERSRTVYDREKRGDYGEAGPLSAGLLVNAEDGSVRERFLGHRGVVATAAISPDGAALVTGGWDRTVRLFQSGRPEAVDRRVLGWSVRRVRFARDGRTVGVAAWTPARLGDSDPSAVVYALRYGEGTRVDR